MPAKTPRFDPYQKLFYRLYEAILLLATLNKSQGPHLIRYHDASDILAIRRRFLDNLAFICDYKKGGDTATALAVEDTQKHFMFWIAMNTMPDENTNVMRFLRAVLYILRGAAALPVEETVELEIAVLRLCIDFAGRRLFKVSRNLSNAAKNSIALLKSEQEPTDLALATWLAQFQTPGKVDLLDLCVLAWSERHSPEVQQLEKLSRPVEGVASLNIVGAPFKNTRHYMGRLADHVRVVKQLMEDCRYLQPLLESFEVDIIPVPEAVPLPPYDGHITLKGILGRMLPSHDPRRQEIEDMIANLQRIMPAPGVEGQIVQTFQEGKFQAQVHAEVQVLEFFSPIGSDPRAGRLFAFGDRYIGCSQLSCLGCKLYFQHHPSRPVARETHERLWHLWSPPCLPGGSEDAAWKAQRTFLQPLIKDISEAALDRINGLVQVGVVHPGSVTNITRSAAGADSDNSDED